MNNNQTSNRTDGNIIETKDLEKHFRSAGDKVKAVDGITLNIPRGKMIAIRGSSGSGKTTLLNLIGALDKPSSGSIVVDGSMSRKYTVIPKSNTDCRKSGLCLPVLLSDPEHVSAGECDDAHRTIELT